MKKNPDISFLLIPSHDGVTTAFPISKHVLDTSGAKPGADSGTGFIAGKVRRFIPTVARPATTLAILLCVWTMSIGSSYAGSSTMAYFRDAESSSANAFAAGSLSFDLNPGEVVVPIEAGDTVTLNPRFMPHDGFPIAYRVQAHLAGDPSTFCSRLHASGTTTPFEYAGQLTSLVTAPSSAEGHGHLEVTLTDATDLISGMQCTVDLVYTGWHADMPEGAGYTDEKFDRFVFEFVSEEAEMQMAAPATDEVPEEVVDDGAPEDVVEEIAEEPVEEPTPIEEVVEETAPEEVPQELVETPETNEEVVEEEPIVEPMPEPEPTPEPTPEPEPILEPEPAPEPAPTE